MQVLTADDVGIWIVRLVPINLELIPQLFQADLVDIVKGFDTIYHVTHKGRLAAPFFSLKIMLVVAKFLDKGWFQTYA